MTSTSYVGSTRIVLQFDLNRDIDGAARDVQAAINAARADLPASAAQQPDLPQGQSRRRADPDPGADLRHPDAGPDLRRGLHHPPAEAVAGDGRRAMSRSAAARCRRCGSSSIPRACSTTASAWRTCAPRIAAANANRPKGAIEARRAALQIYANDQPTHARPTTAAGRRLPQRRARCGCSDVADGRRVGREHPQRRARPTASRRCWCMFTGSPAPTSSRPSTACAHCCRSCRRRCRRDIDLTVALDRTTSIRASLRDVEIDADHRRHAGHPGGVPVPAQLRAPR